MSAPDKTFDGPGFAMARHGGIATLTLNMPSRRNAFVWPFWKALKECLLDLDEDGATRVLIMKADGAHFSAGMDFSFFRSSQTPDHIEEARFRETLHTCILQLNAAIDTLEQVRFPILAAIQGSCVGAALDLICAANLRYGTQDCQIVAAEVMAGLAPDMGTLQRLPSLIPAGVAHELVFTGRPFIADEAKSHGFLSDVLPDKVALDAKTEAIAAQIAAMSPIAVSGIKRSLLVSRDHGPRAGQAHIAAWNAAHFISTDIAASLSGVRTGERPPYADLCPKEVDWVFEAPEDRQVGSNAKNAKANAR